MQFLKQAARSLALAGVLAASTAVSAYGYVDNSRYTVTDLGTHGGARSEALAVNDFAEVGGFAQLAGGEFHGFIWNTVSLIDALTLGGDDSYITSLNRQGISAGHGFLASGAMRAFR